MRLNFTCWKLAVIALALLTVHDLFAAVISSRFILAAQLGQAAVIEDFESYIFPDEAAIRVGVMVDEDSIIEGQGPGLVKPGVRFIAPDAEFATWRGLQWDRQFSYGLTSAAMVTDGLLVADFTVPVTHVGFDMFWFNIGTPLTTPSTVQIYATDDTTLLYSTNIFEPFAPDFHFFGYSDTRGIGKIVLFRDEAPFISVSPIIDNLIFGYVVSLEISQINQQVTLTWPADAIGYQLQSTTTTDQSDSWVIVQENPTISNGQNVISLECNDSRKFFRLIKPLPE